MSAIEDELRATFARQVLPVDDALTFRAAAARRRARQLEVRRWTAIGATTALAAAALAAFVVLEHRATPEGADPIDGRIGIVRIEDSFAGRTLLDAKESTGGMPLTLRVDAGSGSEWLIACTRVGPEYVLHQTVNGQGETTAPCSVDAGIGDTLSFRFTTAEPAGNDRELQVWLTEGEDGPLVSPGAAVLAAAVYTLPDPVTTLAGADVLPVEVSQDEEWDYVDGAESAPGSRSFARDLPALDGPGILELILTGSSDAAVRLLVDGEVVDTVPSPYRLGSVQLGDRLTGGSPHRVTLEILGDVPDDARLGIVRRALR